MWTDGEVGMKAVIHIDVPEYQIGQPVHVFFKDTMEKHGVCETEQEIVRCKDCKHCGIDSTSYPQFWCSAHTEYHDGDWFCADGVKKE